VDESKLPKIIKALERVGRENKTFLVEFGNLGIFPDAVYLGVENGIDELRALHLSLVSELGDLAVRGRFEGSQMIPHLTLLHFKSKDVGDCTPPIWTVV
jgi:2'-5' RNA ligase